MLLENKDDPVDDMEEVLKRMQKISPRQRVLPDTTTYKTVMNGWVKSGRPGYVERVDELFRMALSLVQNNHCVLPELCGIAMDAWARSRQPGSADRCQEIFREISEPSIIHYNILMKAYALSRQPEQCEALLIEMQSKPGIQADEISFNTAMLGWSIAGDSQRALSLLESMLRICAEKEAAGFSPGFPSRTTIDSIFRTDPESVLETATTMWGLISTSGIEDKTDLLVNILNTLGKETEKELAWDVIQECIDKVLLHDVPATAVLVSAVDSCCRLYSDEGDAIRAERLTELFHKFSEYGVVDEAIIDVFRKCLPPPIYHRVCLQDPRRPQNREFTPETRRQEK